jgi:hypothetical protein
MTQPHIASQITWFYTPDLAETAHLYEHTIGLPLKFDQGIY